MTKYIAMYHEKGNINCHSYSSWQFKNKKELEKNVKQNGYVLDSCITEEQLINHFDGDVNVFAETALNYGNEFVMNKVNA